MNLLWESSRRLPAYLGLKTHELDQFFFLCLHTLSLFFLGEWERDEEDNLGQSIVQVPRYPQGLSILPRPLIFFSPPTSHLPPPPLFRIYLCHVRFYGPLSHECTCLPPLLYYLSFSIFLSFTPLSHTQSPFSCLSLLSLCVASNYWDKFNGHKFQKGKSQKKKIKKTLWDKKPDTMNNNTYDTNYNRTPFVHAMKYIQGVH